MNILIIIVIVIVAVLGMILLLSLIKKDSDLAELGINLKRVYCPNCELKQPVIRKPKNQNQILFGGYTCKNCGTEMDKYGVEIGKRSSEND